MPLLGRRAVVLDLRGHGRSDAPESGYDLASLSADVGAVIDAVTDGLVDLMTFSRAYHHAIAWAMAIRNASLRSRSATTCLPRSCCPTGMSVACRTAGGADRRFGSDSIMTPPSRRSARPRAGRTGRVGRPAAAMLVIRSPTVHWWTTPGRRLSVAVSIGAIGMSSATRRMTSSAERGRYPELVREPQIGEPLANAGSQRRCAPARLRPERQSTRSRYADSKPNILVIWGDDIGISNRSCYSHGLMALLHAEHRPHRR